MQSNRSQQLFAVLVSVALHALAFGLAGAYLSGLSGLPARPKPAEQIVYLQVAPPPSAKPVPEPEPPVMADEPAPAAAPSIELPPDKPAPAVDAYRPPASMAAPPAPTAEEWAFAARYTLKNSKGYRYTWGQQVRSMMGTAVEGPDQGMVRFRVEIAPDGSLARLETLWTTSAVVEQKARQAIENMPPSPPTPTGKPLIFDRTISFTPFAADGPPLYRYDCLPDPPAYGNRFAWDGKSPQVPAEPMPVDKPDPQALEDCLKQLPRDSIEAESARDQRLMDRWGWSRQRQ